LLVLVSGCGGGESYTERALEEYRVGSGADFAQARKKPAAKDLAAWRKKMKAVAPGSKDDFYQGLWVLNTQRDHDQHMRDHLAKSLYLRAAYFRVFGKPADVQKKGDHQVWSHSCTDGKVTLQGLLQVADAPDYLLLFPPKW
jgi:hypothetical protein